MTRKCKFCGAETEGEYIVEEIRTFIALCESGECAEKAEAWKEAKLQELQD